MLDFELSESLQRDPRRANLGLNVERVNYQISAFENREHTEN